jgi:GTP-binding protein HflX
MAPIDVLLPYEQGRMISLFHEAGAVERVEHLRNAVHMSGRIPKPLLADFAPFQKRRSTRKKADSETASE